MVSNNGNGRTPGGLPSTGMAVADKALDLKALGESVIALPPENQSQTPTIAGPAGFVLYVAQAADGFIPWGQAPKARDVQLRDFFPKENLLASALFTVCARNAALSWKVSGDDKAAEAGQQMLNNVNNGAGWEDFASRLSIDLYSQDAGAFIEFVRDGKGEDAPVISLNSLDAARCYATGDPEYPVIYEDTRGNFHRMPWHNVVQLLEFPTALSPQYLGAYYRMQYSAVTRVLRAAQMLRSLSTYNDEKLSGRFMRAIHLISGVGDTSVQDAITRAQNYADQSGQTRYIQPAIVGGVDPNAAIGHVQIDLASLPEGWQQTDMMKDYILALALALGTDYGEFAPLPGGNLGTATQSETMHAKARGKGPGLWQKLILRLINQNGALPKGVEFEFDEPDLDADQQREQIALVRAQTRTQDISSGVLDAEAARQQMLEDGDITQAIYDDLEKRAKEREEEAKRQAEEQAALAATQPGSTSDAQPQTTMEGEANRTPASGAGQTTRGEERTAGAKDAKDITQERLDYEAAMAKRVQHGLDEAEAILRAHLQGRKENPYHDPANGQFTNGPGGGGAATSERPRPHNPVTPIARSDEASWAGEVARLIEAGDDPSVKAVDYPALLEGMSHLDSHPDITELNIAGTLLLGGEGLGIPRKDMPQVPPEQRDRFISDLKANGVSVVEERVDPTRLKPIQTEVSGARAGAIYMRLKAQGIPDEERILVTQDNYVVDGHHTWAAAIGMHYTGVSKDMPIYRMSLSAQEALKQSLDWAEGHGFRYDATKALLEVGEKFNPNHDELGRFSEGPGGGDVSMTAGGEGGGTGAAGVQPVEGVHGVQYDQSQKWQGPIRHAPVPKDVRGNPEYEAGFRAAQAGIEDAVRVVLASWPKADQDAIRQVSLSAARTNEAGLTTPVKDADGNFTGQSDIRINVGIAIMPPAVEQVTVMHGGEIRTGAVETGGAAWVIEHEMAHASMIRQISENLRAAGVAPTPEAYSEAAGDWGESLGPLAAMAFTAGTTRYGQGSPFEGYAEAVAMYRATGYIFDKSLPGDDKPSGIIREALKKSGVIR